MVFSEYFPKKSPINFLTVVLQHGLIAIRIGSGGKNPYFWVIIYLEDTKQYQSIDLLTHLLTRLVLVKADLIA